MQWALGEFGDISWGVGVGRGSFTPKVSADGKPVSLFWAFIDGNISLLCNQWAKYGLSEPARGEIRDRFNDIDGVELEPSTFDKRVDVHVGQLDTDVKLDAFKETLAMVAGQLKSV